jgi:hypothetical protein
MRWNCRSGWSTRDSATNWRLVKTAGYIDCYGIGRSAREGRNLQGGKRHHSAMDAGTRKSLPRYTLWMLRPAEPAQQLRRYVRKYVHVESSLGDSVLSWPIPTRSVTCIEFTFGDPYRIHHSDGLGLEITYPATLIGAKTCQRIRLELHGHVETFAILFQPTGL